MTFLRAVDTLASAVRAQANGSMNNYIPKTLLAKKIETLMLEEGGEFLTSSVRQQAMLSIVTLRFPLRPPPAPGSPCSEHGTVQALDDMLQALVMDGRDPNMAMLQRMLDVDAQPLSHTSQATASVSRPV
ncbi:hypothetical protein MDA_GLEAN10008037 [Myotis davidii]|uniref:Uncharacterized protein n=1 Tax=Myotis davidii TaxID=225400 RepID=L5LGA1_MYODS|nr:hypothetical protein MDA_GLEAN10008037 [Myotis davidii]